MAKKKALYGSRKKYHYLYKTTNLINGCYYYGMHSTDNLNDGYLGSGKLLKRALNKHGIENFKIEILKHFDSREELAQAEKEIITEEMIENQKCYNISNGGTGGIQNEKHSKKLKKGASRWLKNMWENPEYRNKISKVLLGNSIKSHKEGKIKYNTFTGRQHSEESKKKMSQIRKGKYGLGEKNSQYGTCWITNEKENKKIKKGDLIPKGWRLGRKIK